MVNPFTWLWDRLTTSDDERARHARDRVERAIMGSDDAVAWLRQSGWSASGGDVSAALHNPTTRDAAIFSTIQSFYTENNDAARMMQGFTANGLNNGTTTHSYILQSPGSNHRAVMVVDESQSPPVVTLAFRGVQPGINFLAPLTGLVDALMGKQAGACERNAEAFWQGAQGQITEAMNALAQRHPGVSPQVVLAGHSYGSDAAARMVPRMAMAFPQWQQHLSLVGYGGTASFTRDEASTIYRVLGSNPERARQYRASNDWINNVPGGHLPGERRNMAARTGHEYSESSELAAMMNALEEQMKRDPRAASDRARQLVDEFRRDPDAVLAQLAAYTQAPPVGDGRFLAAGDTPRLLH